MLDLTAVRHQGRSQVAPLLPGCLVKGQANSPDRKGGDLTLPCALQRLFVLALHGLKEVTLGSLKDTSTDVG